MTVRQLTQEECAECYRNAKREVGLPAFYEEPLHHLELAAECARLSVQKFIEVNKLQVDQ